MEWKPIETAPKDDLILVWFDHSADTYHDFGNPSMLTDYAAWAEAGGFMDGSGYCLAKWHSQHWESVDEYGGGYYLPAAWFAMENDDFERVVNPILWAELPKSPESGQ